MRKLFLGTVVAALTVVIAVPGVLLAIGGVADSPSLAGNPVVGYGGPFERAWSVVPPIHDAIWPTRFA